MRPGHLLDYPDNHAMRKSKQELVAVEPLSVKSADRRGRVQSATTAVEVLKALGQLGGGASLTALAAALGENPAKVHRYLASLCAAEFVIQEASTSRYVLGHEAIALGLAAMRQSQVLELAGTALAQLAAQHDLSCFVSVMGSHGPTVVRLVEPMQAVTVNVKAGSVMPVLWSATGRVFGAFAKNRALDDRIHAELAAASPERRRLLPDHEAVETLFASVRSTGCAPVVDTLMAGISAVAYPIFNAHAEMVAVLTALGPTGAFDPTSEGTTTGVVQQAAQQINERLGHRPAVG